MPFRSKLPETVVIDRELELLLKDFFKGRREDLSLMEKALDAGDWNEVARIAHVIKGVCGGYGFDEVGEVGERIEMCVHDRNGDEIRGLVKMVTEYFKNVKVVLE